MSGIYTRIDDPIPDFNERGAGAARASGRLAAASFLAASAIEAADSPYLSASSAAGPDSGNTSWMPSRTMRVGQRSAASSATALPSPPDHVVVLHGDRRFARREHGDDPVRVERLHRVHGEHRGPGPLFMKHLRGPDHAIQHEPGGDEGHVRAVVRTRRTFPTSTSTPAGNTFGSLPLPSRK